MAKCGHNEEEILRVLREAEVGGTVVHLCRKHGISQQSLYFWKKKYAGLGLKEFRELRQPREENGRLKRLVADLSLDGHIIQEIVEKKPVRPRAPRAGLMEPEDPPAEHIPYGMPRDLLFSPAPREAATPGPERWLGKTEHKGRWRISSDLA